MSKLRIPTDHLTHHHDAVHAGQRVSGAVPRGRALHRQRCRRPGQCQNHGGD